MLYCECHVVWVLDGDRLVVWVLDVEAACVVLDVALWWVEWVLLDGGAGYP